VPVALSEKLLSHMKPPYSKVFFSDDGSTAVEAALKMTMQYFRNLNQPQRKVFASIDNSYHGDTLGAVAVGNVGEFHEGFEKVLPVVRLTSPYCYRCPLNQTFPSCETACADMAIEKLKPFQDRLAALIIEPLVLGAGGMITYPKSYLAKVTAFAKECGALVIYDEVFTGFGRTGTLFAYEQADFRPDIVCLSKGLTSGMLPLAVTVTQEKVYQAFQGGGDKTFFHGHTFSGNALSSAVALESLKIFEEENTLHQNKKLEKVMAENSARFEGLPQVGNVRHLGMIWNLEIVTDKKSKATQVPSNRYGWRIAESLLKKGIWMRPLHQNLYLLPPYCTSESDLQRVFDVLYKELHDSPIDR
jgi:adenosylmethionine-8-amino-7-oxononanoate aminotransferase